MSFRDSYEVRLEARRARAALQGELLARLARGVVERASCGWFAAVSACRRRLREFGITEACAFGGPATVGGCRVTTLAPRDRSPASRAH